MARAGRRKGGLRAARFIKLMFLPSRREGMNRKGKRLKREEG